MGRTSDREGEATFSDAANDTAWNAGSWLWDLRSDALQWSPEFHRIHDIDPLDFPGTFESYMDLIVSEDRDTVRLAMTGAVDASAPLELEYRILDTDDKTRAIRVSADPIVGSDGNAIGLRGVGYDVTDQARSARTRSPLS